MKKITKDMHQCPNCDVLDYCGKTEIKEFELKITNDSEIIKDYLMHKDLFTIYNENLLYTVENNEPIFKYEKIVNYIEKTKIKPFFHHFNKCFYEFSEPNFHELMKILRKEFFEMKHSFKISSGYE